MATLDLYKYNEITRDIVMSELSRQTLNITSVTQIKNRDFVKIKDYAFKDFTELSAITKLYISEYGDHSFENTSIVTIGVKYTSTIGKYAFNNCTKLTTIRNVENLTSIQNYAFANCISLLSTDLRAIEYIYDNAFQNCSNLTKLANCSKILKIGNYAFDGCTNFPSKIELPNCAEIGRYAFRDCKNLESLIAPNCTFVDYNAFYGTKLWDVEPS